MRLVLVGCSGLAALAACSGTPSSPQTLRAEALHFDSLATLAVQSHDTNATRRINLEVLATALAQGAQPGIVTMTIAGTAVTVHIVGIQLIDTNAVNGRVYAAGWVDADADTSIAVDVVQTTTGFIVQRVALAIGDSSAATQTFPSTYPFTVQNVNGSCTNYPITNHVITPGLPCHLGQGTVLFTADVQAGGSPPIATPIVSPSVTFGLAQFVGF